MMTVAWPPDEFSYWRKYCGRADESEREDVVDKWRAKEIADPSGKHEVVKSADKENRATSAATPTWRKPEDLSVSPPLKARKFERYVDDVPRGGEGTEHLLKIPECAVREVLGGCDRGYDLPERTAKEFEMRIAWAKIGEGEVIEEEVLNGTFEVP